MAIQVLDQNTINKIAAGEVIERPSSVVKELVENAIDAKATAITVEIKDGGISFIRVTDNGCGIDKSELPVAFLRHSTSKIKSIEDLMCVASLGFRGEALSSIAAVSQIELITKTKTSLTGARYVIEGGMEQQLEEIGAPDGTTFIVRNLFFNTPVRRKFLKTAATEAGYVSALIEHLALSRPDISFRFINNNQNRLHTSGNGNLKDIVYHIYGRDIAANLIELKSGTQDITIEGFAGKPLISRGNRTYENYFINGRYIKSAIITKAVEEAYKGYIMAHQYPFTALHFNINPQIIDVNVHPTKMELRFERNEYVYDFVYNSVRAALEHRELIPEVNLDNLKQNVPVTAKEIKPNQKIARIPEPFEVKREEKMHSDLQKTVQQINEDTPQYTAPDFKTAQIEKNIAISQEIARRELNKKSEQLSLFENEPDLKLPRIIGQLFNTYWLIELDDKLFIMDQHAAHEKILYERMMNKLITGTMSTQLISPPIILSLNLREEEVLKNNIEAFEKMGFELESFGGSEYKVTGIPASLPELNEKDLVLEILDSLTDENTADNSELITEKVASMSCKAAVKGNMQMSLKEAEALVAELMKADNPYNCPHGRPTLISMTKYELEKKFRRII